MKRPRFSCLKPGGFLLGLCAFGGTVLIPSSTAWASGAAFFSPRENPRASEKRDSGEVFADSYFGREPQKPVASRRSQVVAEALSDLRAEETSERSDQAHGLLPKRGLASLEFSEEPAEAGRPQPRSVVPEKGMPRTKANENPIPQSSLVRTGVQELSLIAGDLGFFPKTLIVTQGIPVRIFLTGASKKALCFMMETASDVIRKQVKSHRIEEIQFTPKEKGRIRFYCPMNGSEGSLLVKDSGHVQEESEASRSRLSRETPGSVRDAFAQAE
ncbi:MAG: cupredoxin domain-containing protein [Bdellovibrionia bacterium]